MKTLWTIRAIFKGGDFDVNVGASNLFGARKAFERDNSHLAPFDWRGAVVFCQDTKPFEEIRPRANGWAT